MVTAESSFPIHHSEPEESLRFQSLALENWKNFAQVDVELSERVFLLGPNASGKSNFLDAIRFLHRLTAQGGGLQQAVAERGGIGAIRSFYSSRTGDISLKARVGTDAGEGTWTYQLTFGEQKGRVVVRQETVEKAGETLLDRPDDADRADPERLSQTHLEQVFANQPFRRIAEFFRATQYLHVIPQWIRDSERSPGHRGDPYGRGLIEEIAALPSRERTEYLQRVAKILGPVVPHLKALRTDRPAEGEVSHLWGCFESNGGDQVWKREEELSDGTLRLLGLLWSLQQEGGTLLLEEPELSLHREVIRQIPQMFALANLRSGLQVVVSTHSPELLSDEGIRPDEIKVLRPGAEGTEILNPLELPSVPDLLEAGMPLAEAVVPYTASVDAHRLSIFDL